jgi:polyphosphate kinase
MSRADGRPSYLDEDAGSLDSAARHLALAEDADGPPAERLRVLADVGRFHLSSGDLALAHLDRQVDVAVPVDNPVHRARLEATVDVLVRCPAWEMDADGTWYRRGPGAEDGLRRLAASAATFGETGVSLH